MESLLVAALGILSGLMVVELYAWLAPLTGWFAQQAAKLLPKEARDRYLEEWLADLDTLPVSLARLLRCFDLYRAALALRIEAAALNDLKALLATKWHILWITRRLIWSYRFHGWRWEVQCWWYRPGKRPENFPDWFLASVRLLRVAADMTLITKLESRLDRLLAKRDELLSRRDGTLPYQTLWQEMAEERKAIDKLRAKTKEIVGESADALRDLHETVSLAVAEGQLVQLAAGGYRRLDHQVEKPSADRSVGNE
jgi:hypothetical protein